MRELAYHYAMNDFPTIITKLKSILSQTMQRKVHDKDLAIALGLSPSTFASIKRRNTIPYRAILDFCARHHINANTLLFSRPANNPFSKPATIRYYDEIGASAGGGGNVRDEHFKELTLQQLFGLFVQRLCEPPS